MNARLAYWSNPCHSIKVLMIARLVHRNGRSVPWAGEKALSLMGEQGLTSHDIGLRTSKSSSPPEEPGVRILRGYCGAKEFGNPGPFHIKPKAHAEEEKVSEDEQKGPNCQETSSRTILFSANRDHGRKKWHATKGSLLERPKGKHKCNETAMGE